MQRPFLRNLNLLLLSPLLIAAVTTVTTAGAHITVTSPKPRYADQKDGPCGRGADDARTKNVTTLAPGSKITVTWKETVPHPGHFRISFSADGVKGFADPKTATELNTTSAVLVDDIADKTGTQTYSQEVTLPDVECTNCTLQVIQIMTDKPPYGDGNDLYYQCADLILTKGATGVVEDDAGTEDPTPTGSSGTTATPAPAANDSGCATSPRWGGSNTLSLAGALLGLAALGGRRLTRRRRSTPR